MKDRDYERRGERERERFRQTEMEMERVGGGRKRDDDSRGSPKETEFGERIRKARLSTTANQK